MLESNATRLAAVCALWSLAVGAIACGHEAPVGPAETGVGGKADDATESQAAAALEYRADPRLHEADVLGRLDASPRLRREFAWDTAAKVLSSLRTHDGVAGAGRQLPLFFAWPDVAVVRSLFQDLYADHGADNRRTRAPFQAASVRSASDRVVAERLERLGGGQFVPGISRVAYSPSAMRHIVDNYGSVAECIETIGDLGLKQSPDDPDNFTFCFDEEFPDDAVMIKAQWSRSDFGRDMPVYRTDAERLAGLLDPESGVVWDPMGDGRAMPDPSEVFTVRRAPEQTFRLTGLHIMTKELRHWQWITLWWSDDPNSDFGEDRPASFDNLAPVWSNYKMCVVDNYRERVGLEDVESDLEGFPTLQAAMAQAHFGTDEPTWCSNPYLEHGEGNVATNCMGCHQHGGAVNGFDIDGDGTEDPLDLLGLVQREDHGHRVRTTFPADYGFAMDRGDDYAGRMLEEIQFFDAFDGDRTPSVEDRIATVSDLIGSEASGAVVFDDRCSTCHGPKGAGALGPTLVDVVALSDAEVIDILLRGPPAQDAEEPTNLMPSMESLADQQLADVLAFLRSL